MTTFYLISLFDYESIGVRSLSGSLHSAKIPFRVHYFQPLIFNSVTLPSDSAYKKLLKEIMAFSPDFIGLSVRSPFLQVAKRITQLIHDNLDTPVIWGGAHATMMWQESLKDADYICIGEGEISLVEMLKNPPKTSNNYYLPKGIINQATTRPEIQWTPRLDDLPDPLFSNKNSIYQDGNQIKNGDPLLNEDAFTQYGEAGLHELLGSRGCPFQCSFCSAPIISSSKVRTRSVSRIVNEINSIRSIKQVEKITFLDEVFGAKTSWLKDLAEIFPKKVSLPFTAEMHPEICTEERVKLAVKAGLSGVEMGIQSGSERIRRDVLNRPVKQKRIIDAIHILTNYGVSVTVDLILDNPYETEADLAETFELLLALPRPLGVKTFSLCHFPGTALTKQLLKDGHIRMNDIEHIASKSHSAWRATISQPREPWRSYWTTLIMLAGLKKFSNPKKSWLSTPTKEDPAINVFSVEDLHAISKNKTYKSNPELLHEFYLKHSNNS